MMQFLANFATTNARIALSLVLWCLLTLVALAGMLLGRIGPPELQVLDHIGTGLLIAMGVDVVQYIGKRVTFDPEAHATPLRSDTIPARDDVLAPAAIAPPVVAAPATPAAPGARTAEGLPRPTRAG